MMAMEPKTALTVIIILLVVYVILKIYRHFKPQDRTGKRKQAIVGTIVAMDLDVDKKEEEEQEKNR